MLQGLFLFLQMFYFLSIFRLYVWQLRSYDPIIYEVSCFRIFITM